MIKANMLSILNTLYTYHFQNSILSFENAVDAELKENLDLLTKNLPGPVAHSVASPTADLEFAQA